MRRILAIVNPVSGSKNKQSIVSQLHQELHGDQIEFSHKYTQIAGHAVKIAKQAVKEGIDTIIAVGGDGTVNEVSSQLIGSNTKLGIISLGSGNGFARHLNIHRNIKESIEIIKADSPITIDSCSCNDVPYVNVSGIGIDGKVAYQTKDNIRRGLWPYVFSSIKEGRNFKSFEAVCCYDNTCTIGDYKAIVVANGPLYGFNFKIAPKASIEDGLLDIMLFKDYSFLKYSLDFPKFILGNLHNSKYVDMIKTPKLTVELKSKQYSHIDGEGRFTDDLKYEFQINPKSLRVLV